MANDKVEKLANDFAEEEGLTTRKSKNGIFFYYKHKFDDFRNFESYISFDENDEDVEFAINMIRDDLDNYRYSFRKFVKQKEVSLEKYYPDEYYRVSEFLE